jgi:hypothetical protein
MLSSVLRSKRAVHMNILIIRAFIRMREVLASHRELALRLQQVEQTQDQHASVITVLVDEINDLKALPDPPKRPNGFKTAEPGEKQQPVEPRRRSAAERQS